MAYFGGTVSQRPWPRLDIRFALLLIVSVGGLVAAIWLAKDSILEQLEQRRAEQAPVVVAAPAPAPQVAQVVPVSVVTPAKTIDVFVAVNQIEAGTRLSPALFKVVTKEANDNLSANALLNLDQMEGAYSRIALSPGAPLLKDFVSATNPMNSVSAITERIPAGYRAVAIPVNLVTGVEGWVQPGAHVDVVWTTESRGRLVTTTLIENAQVLSAERRLETQHPAKDGGEAAVPAPSHVTLLVSTRDSQRLQLAKNSGSLSLSLRGKDDVDPGNAATLSADTIIKNRFSNGPSDIQGKVSYDGKEFVLRGTELVPNKGDQALAKMKDGVE